MATRKRASAVDHKNQESLNVICKIMRSSHGVKLESKNTFQGIELCNWLIRANYARDVETAVVLSNQLMKSTHTFKPLNNLICFPISYFPLIFLLLLTYLPPIHNHDWHVWQIYLLPYIHFVNPHH